MNCKYCDVELGEIACRGRDGHLYCSASCCEKGELKSDVSVYRRLHGRLPKPIEIKLDPVPWWVCRMHDGGHFAAQMATSPRGSLVGENHVIAAGSYAVVYGPCTYDEAEEYMDDTTGM